MQKIPDPYNKSKIPSFQSQECHLRSWVFQYAAPCHHAFLPWILLGDTTKLLTRIRKEVRPKPYLLFVWGLVFMNHLIIIVRAKGQNLPGPVTNKAANSSELAALF